MEFTSRIHRAAEFTLLGLNPSQLLREDEHPHSPLLETADEMQRNHMAVRTAFTSPTDCALPQSATSCAIDHFAPGNTGKRLIQVDPHNPRALFASFAQSRRIAAALHRMTFTAA